MGFTLSKLNPLSDKDKFDPKAKPRSSTLVMPGKYKVTLSLVSREGEKQIGSPVEFNVVPLFNSMPESPERKELVAFQQKANELARTITGTEKYLNDLIDKVGKAQAGNYHNTGSTVGCFGRCK